MNMTMMIAGLGVVTISYALLGRVMKRIGLPVLLLFIGAGIVCAVFLVKPGEEPGAEVAWQIASVALVLQTFYAGFGLRLQRIEKRYREVLVLLLGALLTVLLTGPLFALLVSGHVAEGMLGTALVCAGDVFAGYQFFKNGWWKFSEKTTGILSLLCGASIPLMSILTAGFSAIIAGRDVGQVAGLFALQLIVGILAGIILGMGGLFILHSIVFLQENLEELYLIGIAMVAFAVSTILGGNGFLSVWIAALIMGNGDLSRRRKLTGNMESLAGMSEAVLFFLLGLSVRAGALVSSLDRVAILLLLTVILVRPLLVFALTRFFREPLQHVAQLSGGYLSGGTSIALAFAAVTVAPDTGRFLMPLVLVSVVCSLLLQSFLTPWLMRKFRLEEPDENPASVYNDYQENRRLQSLVLKIEEGHPFLGLEAQELDLPKGIKLALIRRMGWAIPPQNDTHILEGDELVLGAASVGEEAGQLWMVPIDENHPWAGKKASELDISSQMLVVDVRRGEEHSYPTAIFEFKAGDEAIVYSQKKSLW